MPPVLGNRRRIGSSSGAVTVCRTAMIGANGLTQDSTACISVTHNMRLKVHLTQVITAARAAGISMRADGTRSEEHTSELQSLLRISVAVFCLKTNQNTLITPTSTQ